MANFSAADVKRLREQTGAGMLDCKNALQEADGDLNAAIEILRLKGVKDAGKRAARTAGNGLVTAELDGNSAGVLVELNCETDFVARTDEFKQLARDIALQIASTRPLAVRVEEIPADVVERERRIYEAQVIEQKKPEQIRGKIVEGMLKKFFQESVLMEQPFVKDDKVTIGDLVKAYSGKTGEKVHIHRFARFELGGN